MTIVEMLQQSAVLTLLGMAVVFAFLWLMIVSVNWVGKLVHKLGLDKDVLPPEIKSSKNTTGAVMPAKTTAVTAAIAAAVNEYSADQNGAGLAGAPAKASGQAAKYTITVNGVNHNIAITPAGTVESTVAVVSAAGSIAAAAVPEATAPPVESLNTAQAPSATVIPSPVAGTILRYAVSEGDHVASGDNVIIIESMKMELEIKATVAGSVHFLAPSGAQVASQQPLAEIG
jgi:oxaloacetate decarboxylase alpha subunit